MIRKIIRKTLAAVDKQQHPSVLSKEYVLENKTSEKDVMDFIKQCQPYHVGRELIRLGSKRDGGYLIPNDLEGVKTCFSPGVYTISNFELDCHKYGMKLFLADKSVEEPKMKLPKSEYHFLKKHIGCFNTSEYITLDSWVNSSDADKENDMMLQMDIEGAEYISIINMSEELISSFRIIIVEFHDLHKIWNQEFYKMASTTFNKIFNTHTCVHIHPNNYGLLRSHNGIEIPSVAEFTFIRNDRIIEKTPQITFPHPLDTENSAKRDPIVLPKIWYNN